ncbi:hypothetical protein PVAP13_9NG570000 [Panicum virgatum]|uniref:Uncharacterized protein n=1 Tax=Panicum virgatum TaxID=38727 RepID=A0A8T0N4V4_PANVG|nr:hypothetical protein PVAP13_9NG570000 [Panicum virgatum]
MGGWRREPGDPRRLVIRPRRVGAASGARRGSTPPAILPRQGGAAPGSRTDHAARTAIHPRRGGATPGIQEGITLPADSSSTRGALRSGVDCDSSSATGGAAKGGTTPTRGLHSSGALKVLHPRQGELLPSCARLWEEMEATSTACALLFIQHITPCHHRYCLLVLMPNMATTHCFFAASARIKPEH